MLPSIAPAGQLAQLRAMLRIRRFEEALIELEHGLRIAPHDSNNAQDVAECHMQAGRRDEERREYLEAVRLERDDADLWELLARSWERAGDRASAQAAWGEVVRIDPSDEEAAEKVGKKP